MERYVIKGGNPLAGEVEIGGAKNAALAILAAAIMTDDTVYIDNMPDERDTNILLQAMESIGVFVERIDRHSVKINASHVCNHTIENEFIKKMRASYYLIGALLVLRVIMLPLVAASVRVLLGVLLFLQRFFQFKGA